jgi:hypothetical protein
LTLYDHVAPGKIFNGQHLGLQIIRRRSEKEQILLLISTTRHGEECPFRIVVRGVVVWDALSKRKADVLFETVKASVGLYRTNMSTRK